MANPIERECGRMDLNSLSDDLVRWGENGQKRYVTPKVFFDLSESNLSRNVSRNLDVIRS